MRQDRSPEATGKGRRRRGACARVHVLVPLPLDGTYDYAADPSLGLAPGDYVRVPLGPRQVVGVVWDGPVGTGRQVPEARLRAVIERLDLPPLPEVSRRFVAWVAGYSLAPLGAVLRMVCGAPGLFTPPKPRIAYGLGGPEPARMTPERARVLAVLADGPPRPATELAREAAVSPAVVRGLVRAGTLIPVPMAVDEMIAPPDPACEGPDLSAAQADAARALRAQVDAGGFSVSVLEGVTGSGKTEVYFDTIAATLEADPQAQVLVLVPEIALTAQWLARFAERFGAPPLEWHSELTPGQRRRAWRAVAAGRARVVVGARSALFLPFARLRLIVVDEEHDPAFKQEDGVVYQARDMAVVRAKLGGHAIVLVSATPSLETEVNARSGRYQALYLPKRHAGAALPEITLIDLRETPPERGRWLSPPLRQAIAEALERGEQALLFLNRRGYAPLTLCRTCGHRIKCPQCTAWLVEHRMFGHLRCHHCDYRTAVPRLCPECGAADSLAACGPGVERMAEEVAETFTQARTAVMTSDTMTGPRAVRALVERMEAGALDIVIGTQIVTKGHHFPLLTVVGIVDADLGLSGGDLRAAERTYQQLSQVAGRAGREVRPGRVFLQTYMPEHPVMAALATADPKAFIEREIAERRAAGYPPFGRLAAVIVSSADEAQAIAAARRLAAAAPGGEGVRVLGPAPAQLAMLRGRHRWRLLLKAGRKVNVPALMRRWLARVETPKSVRIKVDIDPYSFL